MKVIPQVTQFRGAMLAYDRRIAKTFQLVKTPIFEVV
jgi:hypothetical protein